MAKKFETYGEKAKHIISTNNYMVLATSDKKLKPWANPVFYVYDKEYNFYFLSAIDSRHAENITENPQVGVAIFDSTQRVGQSDGVQIEAKAEEVGKKNVEEVITLYGNRLFPMPKISPTERYEPEQYVAPSEFRFFKVAPIKVYVTGVDRRVEVDLSE